MRISMKKVRTASLVLAFAGPVAAQTVDVTFEVSGDMLTWGGAVQVMELPEQDWADAGDLAIVVPLTARYAEVQLRYPAAGDFVFRFRAADGSEGPSTQALMVHGTDMDGRGPTMERGFVGAVSAGGQTVRVLPLAEYAGEDDITRIYAAWGIVEGWAKPPPAHYWGARELAGVFGAFGSFGPRPDLICDDGAVVRLCTPDPAQSAMIDALWWRGLAEGRIERLRDRAVAACRDGQVLRNRPCNPVPGTTWPEFEPSRSP